MLDSGARLSAVLLAAWHAPPTVSMPLCVKARVSELRRAFDNLVDNALFYAGPAMLGLAVLDDIVRRQGERVEPSKHPAGGLVAEGVLPLSA